MNKARREQVGKASFHIYEAQTLIREVLDGEREAFDNLPESLQESERAQQWLETADALSNIAEALDSATDDLGTIDY